MAWVCRPWWAVVVMVGTAWVCTLWLEQSGAASRLPRPALRTSSYNTYHRIYYNTSGPTSTHTKYNQLNITTDAVTHAAIISTPQSDIRSNTSGTSDPYTQQDTTAGRWHQHKHPGQDPSPSREQSNLTSDWESVMSERRSRVSHVCRLHYNSLKRFTIFNRLTFDTKHHLAYCRNAKAGTTSWLRTLLEWAGADMSNMTSLQIHEAAADTFPPLTTEDAAREMQVPPLTFTMARHPFTRLVSAYRDKIPTNYKKDLQLAMIAKYRKEQNNSSSSEDGSINSIPTSQNQAKPIENNRLYDETVTNKSSYTEFVVMKNSSLPVRQTPHDIQLATPMTTLDAGHPSFREFVLYVSDQLLDCLPHMNSNCLEEVDVHWRPLHERCAPCDITYDVIAKVETFAEDEKYLSQVTGLPVRRAGPSTLHNTRGPPTAHLTNTYFSTLSDSERKKVFKAFYYDFLLFGYSYDNLDFK